MSMSLAVMFLLLQTAAATFMQARTSNSFAGSNNYYLHGLLPQEQADYIEAIQADGAKVVRLWGGSHPHSYQYLHDKNAVAAKSF
jgi:hypothetical protein